MDCAMEQNAVISTLRFPIPKILVIFADNDMFLQAFARRIAGTGQVLHRSRAQLFGGGRLPIRRHSSSDLPRK